MEGKMGSEVGDPKLDLRGGGLPGLPERACAGQR